MLATGLVASLAVTLAGCTAGAAAPTPTPSAADPSGGAIAAAAIASLGAGECTDPSAEMAMYPLDGVLCGQLTVPADREEPDGDVVDLEVAVIDPGDAEGVLLLVGGGPGGSATWMAQVAREFMPEVAERYALVAMDVRGTGDTAVDCPDVQEEVGSSDVLQADPDAVAACATVFGDSVDDMSTTTTVEDLEDLREALGSPAWVLDGISYGTYIAERYAAAYPDATSALVLDSVVPVEGLDPLLTASMSATAEVLRAACEASGCESDPAEDLAAVVAAGYPDEVGLFNMVVAFSVLSPTFDGVADALAEARAGDTSRLDAGIESLSEAGAAELGNFSAATHIATLCADTPMPWGSETDAALRQEALDAALAELTPEDTWPFSTSLPGQVGSVDSCLAWPEAGPEATDTDIYVLPDVPTLVLAGGMDLSTPVSVAESLLADLDAGGVSDASLVVIEDSGHGVQYTDDGAVETSEFLLGLLGGAE